MLAGFPMYDWPEVGDATDGFWRILRERLRNRGFDAPDQLSRARDLSAFWRAPDLLIGQICGLPFATELAGRVRLIGTPAYDIGCPPSFYYSVLIARRGCVFAGLERFSGRLAVNDCGSQSGYAAPAIALAAAGTDRDAVEIRVTGSHRASVRAVAEGEAELAAIDAVSFRLATRHMREASEVEIVGCTTPTPGLPLVTALPADAIDGLAAAVAEAVDLCDPAVRDALLLTGFSRTDSAGYAAIASDWAKAGIWLAGSDRALPARSRIIA